MARRAFVALGSLAALLSAATALVVLMPRSSTLSEEDARACKALSSWREGFESAAAAFDALPTDGLDKPDIRVAALRAKAAAVDFSRTVPATPEHAETGHALMLAVGAVKDACAPWTSRYSG